MLVLVFSLPVSARKIIIDYDKKVDFFRFKTYTWAAGTLVPNPSLDLYIMGAIDLNPPRSPIPEAHTPSCARPKPGLTKL